MICHDYIFLATRPNFLELSAAKQTAFKKAFLKELQKEKHVITYTYSTLGLKSNTNILLWMQADSYETIQDFLNRLLHTQLGIYLEIKQTLLGMTRPTQYSPKSKGHEETLRKGGKYLVIYPFVKTKEWYMEDFENRRNLMWGHVQIGKKFPMIEQLLLYSYGIDDSEFLVTYEMEDLSAFQSLVMELRSDKVRAYTHRDTPIFLGIYKTPEEVLEYI